MNKSLADQIGNELLEAAKLIGKKYNLNVKFAGGKFSDSDLISKFKFDEKSETENEKIKMEKLEDSWFWNCERFGIPRDWFGKKLNNGLEIIGLKPRNSKYPILVMDPETGKKYKMSPQNLFAQMEERNNYNN